LDMSSINYRDMNSRKGQSLFQLSQKFWIKFRPIHRLMVLTNEWEGYISVLISVESTSNKDYLCRFMDFRESLTLAMLQSGLNTLYICLLDQWEFAAEKVNRMRYHPLAAMPFSYCCDHLLAEVSLITRSPRRPAEPDSLDLKCEINTNLRCHFLELNVVWKYWLRLSAVSVLSRASDSAVMTGHTKDFDVREVT
jgi:hypothetical protein